MKGDIAIAGFVLTAEEWDAMDARSRAQLVAAASLREDAWIAAVIGGEPEPTRAASSDR